MKALPILLSLVLTVISCKKTQWSVDTFTYDNIARESLPSTHPVRIYYLKRDIPFFYRIIGRAHATCTTEQNYEGPIPEKLLLDQVRLIGGDALLAPKLKDSFTWTGPIIERVD
jgi:hypothetical protein